MDYVPIDHDILEKPEMLQIMRNAGVTLGVTLLHLFRLWRMFDRQTDDGFLPGLDISSLCESCGATPDFWGQVIAVKWLAISPEGLTMPKFKERFRTSAKERMKRFRRNKSVTPAQQERNAVTPTVTPQNQNQNQKETPPKSPKGDRGAPCEFQEYSAYCRDMGRACDAEAWWEYQNRVGWQAARDWQLSIRTRIKAEPDNGAIEAAKRQDDRITAEAKELHEEIERQKLNRAAPGLLEEFKKRKTEHGNRD